MISLNKYGALFAILVSLLGSAPVAGPDAQQQEPPAQAPAQAQDVERVSSAALPARIAFVSEQRLWMLDARDPAAQPVPLTEPGVTQIVGWSHDGQWLAYLYVPPEDPQKGPFLHVVNQDASRRAQVADQPVKGRPAWSPVDNRLLYLTAAAANEQAEARLATLADNGSIQSETLLRGDAVVELAWSPDGQSIAVSEARTADEPLRIRRLSRDGTWSVLYTGESPQQTDELFVREAAGLTWSPNGEYLAYFALPNAASLAADGVPLHLLELATGETKKVGEGLAYPEWLAWSDDSRQLAFIQGSGREATRNKQLQLFQPADGKLAAAGQAGYVDTAPVAADASGSFLFVRGPEAAWGEAAQPEAAQPAGVYVPGQRIWRQSAEGTQSALTTGPTDTADYEPHVSPDGKQLLYVRLSAADRGSLYFKPLAGSAESELIRGLQISPGFYGNYLPRSVAPYWY
ncbi:WD40 repeat domain-containing protein [Brevibacillus marinus]|uniref:WD40 repeat domain-containing protein n=1 Tax=Brevibacillus marinus TaxID=2496837 RepID=UPI000F83413D|nr:hypothetical protein [Brevibacillus marinus]